ncbi:hypothetical protein JCM6294_1559 [Bacteroides pyogenes DSM 20611 = JCM 6294]|uniref:Uncharacterized protein n=1 Tax=Bacteroides pyogenes DSM 20611 = JCM 6294 TaxID=1121100 RepID=W4PGT9_9BACE|nr:hypothetical protein JCM6294_1559 [Bacteroides pyogenes DSM 20611 = JCM 6294]
MPRRCLSEKSSHNNFHNGWQVLVVLPLLFVTIVAQSIPRPCCVTDLHPIHYLFRFPVFEYLLGNSFIFYIFAG